MSEIDNAQNQLKQLAKQSKAWSTGAQLEGIAALAKWASDSAQLKQLAEQSRAWSTGAQLEGIAALAREWNESAQLKQLAEQSQAWSAGVQLKGIAALAREWSESAQLRPLVEQSRVWGADAQLKGIAALAREWNDSAPLKQLAEQSRAWSNGVEMKGLAALAQEWSESAQLKQLAEQSRAWSNGAQVNGLAALVKQWADSSQLRALAVSALGSGLTSDQVLNELASRSSKEAGSSLGSGREQVWADVGSSLSLGGYFTGEVISSPEENRELSKAPTWFLYFWLFFVAPMLYTLENWETMRANLVDMNARMPQTESISEVRRFIRINLAGKPGDVRLVTGSDVRLRAGPGMGEDVIMTLPKYAPVVVLGKEDRTWLFVSYEHEGFVIDGYISTKFLKKVRK